jgi:large subunit ribosomal protein L6
MSRIGKRPVPLPSGVTATTEGRTLSVKGPKGTLSLQMREEIKYDISEDGISVQPANETKQARAFWGMQRTLVQNLVTGVSEGFTKVLEITGVGYRAAAQGRNLRLQLGYSHDVNVAVPEGLEVKTPDPTTVEISGSDRQRVGQLAAEIRRWRKPEPYKGKGIKYRGEFIFRKEGKKK